MDDPINEDDIRNVDEGDATHPRNPKTAVISSNQIKRRVEQSAGRKGGTVYFGKEHQIILVIRGLVERLTISDERPITLGRSDALTRFVPDVDLTAYGALDRGVSRAHARLHVKDDRLFVTDLASTNGTFVGGDKLEPYAPRLIGKGDELILGRLGIQVLFRTTSTLSEEQGEGDTDSNGSST
ncbi:MAG: hypothetical protein OHK0046_01540 [Anaerolineae bacterium]